MDKKAVVAFKILFFLNIFFLIISFILIENGGLNPVANEIENKFLVDKQIELAKENGKLIPNVEYKPYSYYEKWENITKISMSISAFLHGLVGLCILISPILLVKALNINIKNKQNVNTYRLLGFFIMLSAIKMI